MACNSCVITMDADGEYVCNKCGSTYGYHTYSNNYNINMIAKLDSKTRRVIDMLNIPLYAINTIISVYIHLKKAKIGRKHAILYAIIYACRIHNIPRLLNDILYIYNTIYNDRLTKYSLFKIIYQINNANLGYQLPTADKYYYLSAYLAKVQELIITTVNYEYYELLKVKAFKYVNNITDADPKNAAKEAIISSVNRILSFKIKEYLEAI